MKMDEGLYRENETEVWGYIREIQQQIPQLRLECEAKAAKEWFSRGGLTLPMGYFCLDPLKDILFWKESRGQLIKKPDKAKIMEKKYDYRYLFDCDGRLSLVEYWDKSITWPRFDLIFYQDNLIKTVSCCGCAEGSGNYKVQGVGDWLYEDGHIVRSANYLVDPFSIGRQTFIEYAYENGMLCAANEIEASIACDHYFVFPRNYYLHYDHAGKVVRYNMAHELNGADRGDPNDPETYRLHANKRKPRTTMPIIDLSK